MPVQPAHRWLLYHAASLLLGMLLAACAAQPPSPTPEPLDADLLQGRVFVSDALTHQVSERELVPDTLIVLSFNDGYLAAQAGCNSMGAPFEIDAGVLYIGEMSSTLIGCPRELDEQDRWLMGLLGSEPAISLQADRLLLESEGVTLNLVDRRSAEPDAQLVGTFWVLETIITGDVASSVPIDVEASLHMDETGRAQLATGCNRGMAEVVLGNDTLELGPIALTRMACPGERDEVERQIVAVLSAGPLEYRLEAGSLTLTSAEGNGLVYRAGD